MSDPLQDTDKNNQNQIIKPTQYKVVELSTVTDDTIESTLNEYCRNGWLFDQIQFVVRDASRRPSMAFVFFVKSADK